MASTNTYTEVMAFIRSPPRITNLSDMRLNVNERGMGGLTPLQIAVQEGAMAALPKLLACGADATATDAQGRTALTMAHYYRRTHMIEHLVFHDALMRTLAAQLGKAPTKQDVFRAAQHRKLNSFRSDVRQRVESLSKQFVNAARAGELSKVKTIVESGEISMDTIDMSTGETPFAAALVHGRRSVCRYLMAKGANVNGACAATESGGGRSGYVRRFCSTLVAAVRTQDIQLVREIVGQGGALLVHGLHDSGGGICALSEAVRLGDIEMMDALLDLGVRFVRHQSGLVVPHHRGIDAKDLLPSIQPDTLRYRKDDFWHLLCMACWWRQPKLVTHLLETRADLFQHSHSNATTRANNAAVALFLAVYQQNQEIVALLLTWGASVNQSFGRGICAMVAALAVDSPDMLSFLFEHGGDAGVTVKMSYHFTSESLLSAAVYMKAMACAQMLLPFETRPLHRQQALQHAIMDGHADFVGLLYDTSDLVLSIPLYELQRCVRSVSCPLTLDLLLSRLCNGGEHQATFDISVLHETFVEMCNRYTSTELLNVMLAHGIDATLCGAGAAGESYGTASSLERAMCGTAGCPYTSAVVFLVENGVPRVSVDARGCTPTALMAYKLSYEHKATKREQLKKCQEFLASD